MAPGEVSEGLAFGAQLGMVVWHKSGERRVSLQKHNVRTSRPLAEVMCMSFFA
jgi:hypothetical protein